MLKKTMTFTDYDGNERTKDFHFNISKAELLEMNLMTPGGLKAQLEKIVAEKDQQKILQAFKDLVLKSYGEKSEDGMRFVKSKELTEAFTQTEAYSDLYVELATNADAAAAFVNGILPVANQSIPAPADK